MRVQRILCMPHRGSAQLARPVPVRAVPQRGLAVAQGLLRLQETMPTTILRNSLPVPFVAALTPLLACQMPPGPSPSPRGEASTLAQLQEQAFFVLNPQASTGKVTARIDRGSHYDVYETPLDLAWGTVRLSATPWGDVVIDSADLHFEDVAMGDKGLPPSGLQLTNIRVFSEKSHLCDLVVWSQDEDSCQASVSTTLRLAWSLVASDGEVVPLEEQSLGKVRFDLDVDKGDTGLQVELLTLEEGAVWEWAGVVDFRDLELFASGDDVPVADEAGPL